MSVVFYSDVVDQMSNAHTSLRLGLVGHIYCDISVAVCVHVAVCPVDSERCQTGTDDCLSSARVRCNEVLCHGACEHFETMRPFLLNLLRLSFPFCFSTWQTGATITTTASGRITILFLSFLALYLFLARGIIRHLHWQ